jgi:pimeloyl-ACP methyl ester carboxylesterase
MKTSAKLMLISFVILLVPSLGVHADHDSREALIEALVKAPFKTVYHDDGAADATVTAVATPDDTRQDAPAQVRAVLDLGPSCIPLLIAHLDDQRLTSATFDGGRFARAPIQVPLGHVCLDILLNATVGQAVHVVDCADDGLGACVRAGYYFRPDALSRPQGVETMRRVKTRWQRAYRAKRVRFEYPTWLKRG